MELKQRVALVTGGARRVGRAICLRLARAGCDIAVHHRSRPAEADALVAECQAHGVRAAAFVADFEETQAPERLVRQVVEEFGRLDILVNNASTFERMTLEDFTTADCEQTLRINLVAPLALAHGARDELLRRGGRIVNLCDASAQRGWPEYLAYAASKAALESVTRSLARSLAPAVNVVGVAPGVAAWPDDYDTAAREKLLRRIPLGRAGDPEDIAAAVHFLLSEGDYITGVVLPVDGGRGVV